MIAPRISPKIESLYTFRLVPRVLPRETTLVAARNVRMYTNQIRTNPMLIFFQGTK